MGGLTLQYVVTYLQEGAVYTFRALESAIHFNYEVVTAVINFCVEFFRLLYHGTSALLGVLYNILSSGVDFLNECCNFIYGFLVLIWKFVVLLTSVLDLLFRGIEIVAQFVLTGGKWTADAVNLSIADLKQNSYNLYMYMSCTVSEWSRISSGALALVWAFTSSLLVGAFETTKYLLSSACKVVDDVMIGFAESVRYLTDQMYYFLVYYLPNIPKETYLGFITVFLVYLFINSIFNHLSEHDMTFPILHHLRRHRQRDADVLEDLQFEFSDDDVSGSDVESENDHESVSDDNDDDDPGEDEDVEFDVVDESESDESGSDENSNSSDDSDGTSTTLSNDIDIQLPPTRQGRYNLRRSTTPSAKDIDSYEDFEREIEIERDRQKCVVCQDQSKSVLILPCRHMCLCVDCGNQIARARNVARRTCPLCRQRIRTIMNVYI